MDEDKSSRHAKIAIVCFGMVVMCCMFIAMWKYGIGHVGIKTFIVAIVLGVLAAAGGFGAAKTLDL
jgi:hypothetical protein